MHGVLIWLEVTVGIRIVVDWKVGLDLGTRKSHPFVGALIKGWTFHSSGLPHKVDGFIKEVVLNVCISDGVHCHWRLNLLAEVLTDDVVQVFQVILEISDRVWHIV
jgi:hypothetical protein